MADSRMQSPDSPSRQSSGKKTKKKTKSMMGSVSQYGKVDDGSNKKQSSGEKTKKKKNKSVMGVVNMNEYGKSSSQENSRKTKKGKSSMKSVSQYSKIEEEGSNEKDSSEKKGKKRDRSVMMNMSEYGKPPSEENSRKSEKKLKKNRSMMGFVSEQGKVTGSGEPTEEDGKKTPEATLKRKEGSDELAVDGTKVPIPKTYFTAFDLTFDLENELKPNDIVFSYTMVVRSILRTSQLMRFLLVGDQIIDINGQLPLTSADFFNYVRPGKINMTVIRPWNMHHCDSRLPVKCKKDSNYAVVDVHRGINDKNGFEIKFTGKDCMVTKVKAGTRGGHAFMVKDRIRDVESQKVDGMDLQDVRKKFNEILKDTGVCSFLVERSQSLRSSTNPSLTSARAADPPEVEMGDDACEIGAREATRILAMKGAYQKKVKKILTEQDYPAPSTMQTDASSDDSRKSLRGSRKGKTKKGKNKIKKKSNGRSISFDDKNKTFRMPSDVKDPASLQKVTQESGIVAFVRKKFWS